MSFEADFIMRKLRQLPVVQALRAPTEPLPTAQAPSLDGLVMTVKPPPALSPDAVSRRFSELLREHGTRRARATGEKVGSGDELWVDLLCCRGGSLIEGGLKLNYPLDVVEDPLFEGLSKQLVGAVVGGSVICTVVLGQAHPQVALRGATVEMRVSIHRASAVTPVDAKSPAALAKLGRGTTLEAVMKQISAELAEESAGAAWAQACRELLDQVAERGGAQVSDALVDEELRRTWGAAEGSWLSAKGWNAEQQQQALTLWLRNPHARAEVRSRLRLALALQAIAERDNVTPDPEQIEQLMLELAAPYGLDAAGVAELARSEPSVGQSLAGAAFEQQLIGHVLARVEVREG